MSLKKYSPIFWIQQWMDTRAGQTFMQYAYSWGAAVVILGTLFKLTHIEGANTMLFVGMGTEVFVFFISGFERPFIRVEDDKEAKQAAAMAVAAGSDGNEELPMEEEIVIPDTETAEEETSPYAPQPAVETETPETEEQPAPAQSEPTPSMASMGMSAAAASLAAASQAAAQAQLAMSQLSGNGMPVAPQPAVDMEAANATNPEEISEAVQGYADELKELTDVIVRVREQLNRMTTDSEEMENLNRTLTGISTVYELQLKTISKQVVTIETIDEQTRRMATQIEELNNIYARMIKAMTTNVAGINNQE